MITLKKAKQKFKEQFKHLIKNKMPGGINLIGINSIEMDKNEIIVNVESSDDVLEQIPDTFMGLPVRKIKIGKIVAQ